MMDRRLYPFLWLVSVTVCGAQNAQIVACHNGHRYTMDVSRGDWPFAKRNCEAFGTGELVTINDAAENQFIFETFAARQIENGIWIGLHDMGRNEGMPIWVSGSNSTYRNFGVRNPFPSSSDCYVMSRLDGRWSEFWCNAHPVHHTQYVCEKTGDCMDCASSPCQNGGACANLGNDFLCSCLPGFTGNTCSDDIDECVSDPCMHGGVCQNDSPDHYNCDCLTGYTGVRCETEINECASSPCRVGTCVDLVNEFRCDCAPGLTGNLCNEDIDECLSDPCMHGGVCQNDSPDHYNCDCLTGYTGKQCETDIDDCQGSPCHTDATCLDHVNNFTCICQPGFTGELCAQDVNECSSNPCNNGGSCRDQVSGYVCDCLAGYTGEHCDTETNGCASFPCRVGTCVDLVNAFRCDCAAGFTGTLCNEASETAAPPTSAPPAVSSARVATPAAALQSTEAITSSASISLPAAVGAGVGFLALLAIIIVLFLLMKRRKKKALSEARSSQSACTVMENPVYINQTQDDTEEQSQQHLNNMADEWFQAKQVDLDESVDIRRGVINPLYSDDTESSHPEYSVQHSRTSVGGLTNITYMDLEINDVANGNIYSEADEESFYATLCHDQSSTSVGASRVRQDGQPTGLLSIARA